jgi:heme/copper-type cytochrome/quinol oxidase subunit 2
MTSDVVSREMKFSTSKRCLAMAALLFALWTAPAFAQGCAMCYATAKATPKQAQRTINRAILVMIVPPVGVMTLGVGFAFRYGKRRDQENDTDAGNPSDD